MSPDSSLTAGAAVGRIGVNVRLATALLVLAPCLAPLIAPVGCAMNGENSSGQSSSGVETSEPLPPLPTSFPSFAPSMGAVQYNGGTVMRSPTVVTVTWDGDANQSAYEGFVDALGGTSYWAAMSEYSVGTLSSSTATHARVQTPLPRVLDISDIDAYVEAHATKDWPKWNANNVYLLFIPATIFVSATELGAADACDVVDGYHTEVVGGPSGHIPYAAIIGRCHATAGQADLDSESGIASHELVETTSDPHTRSDVGYIGFGANGLPWMIFQAGQDEVSDACEFYQDITFIQPGLSSPVKRFWSNRAAAEGHEPCVPAAPGTYYNATPLSQATIQVTTQKGGGTITTKGYRVSPGTTATFPIGFYSDAPMPAWSLAALEGNGSNPAASPRLKLSLDTQTGVDGDTAHLTVTASRGAASDSGTAVLVTLVSQTGSGDPHFMPLIIGVY